MVRRPQVVVLDVNETLSDMSPLAARWEDVGAPAHLARQWFAELLRDGFAVTAAGGSVPFATVAAATASRLLAPVHPVPSERQAAVAHVLAGLGTLGVHPDVPEGLRSLRAAGIRLVTLTNGSASVAADLLERAGLRGEVEALLSVEDAPRWKPAPEPYAYAAQRCGVPVDELMLVAVHPWDVDGAARAGLRTAWVDRRRTDYPEFMARPELTVPSFTELAQLLGGSSA